MHKAPLLSAEDKDFLGLKNTQLILSNNLEVSPKLANRSVIFKIIIWNSSNRSLTSKRNVSAMLATKPCCAERIRWIIFPRNWNSKQFYSIQWFQLFIPIIASYLRYITSFYTIWACRARLSYTGAKQSMVTVGYNLKNWLISMPHVTWMKLQHNRRRDNGAIDMVTVEAGFASLLDSKKL